MGSVATTVTYLQMLERPDAQLAERPDVTLSRIAPTTSEYLALYDRIGRDFTWTERKLLATPDLAAIIENDAVEIYLTQVSGEPAGYVELDCRVAGEVELGYFGLFPEFCGRGIGPHVLLWAIDRAWQKDIRRMWLHTCTLDHPAALATYQRAGFVIYDTRAGSVATLPEGLV